MNKILLLACLIFSNMVIADSVMASESVVSENNEVKVLDGTIFVVEKQGLLITKMKKANVVHYKVGQEYGWILKLNTNEKVNVTEEFILPSSAPNWTGLETNHKITDNKTSVFKTEMKPKDGIIMNGYGIAEGDPKGTYAFNISVNNKLLKSFKFLVD